MSVRPASVLLWATACLLIYAVQYLLRDAVPLGPLRLLVATMVVIVAAVAAVAAWFAVVGLLDRR